MRNVFLGTTAFAAVVLRRLADSAHRPQLVITRPDAKQGRGQKLAPPPVAVLARELGIDVIQPEKLHEPEILERIASVEPEVLTTCAYGVLIKEPLLSDYEMINVHPSLLPRWRGAAPIERAIMAGDDETGVAIMRVTAGWDSGAVYAIERTPIGPDDDYGTLSARLETIGADLLVKVLDERPTPVEQDEAFVTYAHKIGPRERALDPTQTPEEVERTIRALRPHIGSRLQLPDGTFLGVIAARVAGATRAPAGGLVRAEGDRLLLDCHGGALELTEVRPAGGRPMAAAEWLRGRPDATLVNFRLDPALPGRDLDEVLERAKAEWADRDDEWQPHVCALAARGTQDVLDAMVALGGDPDALNRELAAYVLGQLGTAAPALPAAQDAALSAMAEREDDAEVLSAIACAFGHLGAPHGEAWLLAQRAHEDPDVREAVAFALGGREGDDVTGALIELSSDASSGVRDWATFALGTLARENSPQLRDALAARLDDPDAETRLEAVHGLAVRGDHRADEPARDLLAANEDVESVWTRHLLAETASHIDEA
ncbi:formyltransferase family protein [Solirubrobacter soli]|uniref:formyltransferase family protein n=1 Tax=Solirubrobacter soli TaxID=363832 RepID=UPI00042521AB|nr:formyltransferase family protein [Solirubrobacter soli]